jgi:CHAT domain-containing protein
LLNASEISELKLNADWVVLSACNTAASDGVGAEALSGLVRILLCGGAIPGGVALGLVDDETALLMSDLFQTR